MKQNDLYEFLTEDEAELADLVATRTKTDCWFVTEPADDKPGFYRVFDMENGYYIPAAVALEDLTDALDVPENYENCNLTEEQDKRFREMLRKRYISLGY